MYWEDEKYVILVPYEIFENASETPISGNLLKYFSSKQLYKLTSTFLPKAMN
jgi:hypothetical protein